jgi:hypothetical protein
MVLIHIEKSVDCPRQLDSTNCKGNVFNVIVWILTLSHLECYFLSYITKIFKNIYF